METTLRINHLTPAAHARMLQRNILALHDWVAPVPSQLIMPSNGPLAVFITTGDFCQREMLTSHIFHRSQFSHQGFPLGYRKAIIKN